MNPMDSTAPGALSSRMSEAAECAADYSGETWSAGIAPWTQGCAGHGPAGVSELFLLLCNTGARVSEIIGVKVAEVVLDMSRPAVAKRLSLAVRAVVTTNPNLKKKRVSPHTIRHATAMHLLQAGVDISVIALWLGHESSVTTHCYVKADPMMKERALSRLHEPDAKIQRYRAPDSLIDFLAGL